jgi:hypothetical protein
MLSVRRQDWDTYHPFILRHDTEHNTRLIRYDTMGWKRAFNAFPFRLVCFFACGFLTVVFLVLASIPSGTNIRPDQTE